MQETWLRKSDAAITSEIQEYNFCIFQERKPRKIDFGGGVAILYNNSLQMKQIKVAKFASFELVAGYLHINAGKVTISTLYYPGYSLKQKFTYIRFLSELSDFLVSFCTEGIHIISGDFNIYYEDCERHGTKLLREVLRTNDLFQIVSQPTHNANGTLDLVFINKAGLNLIGDGEVIHGYEFSDHYPFLFDLNVRYDMKPSEITLKTRDLASLNVDKFCLILNESFIHEDLELDTLDGCVENYNSVLQASLNSLTPFREIVIKPRPNQPWYNNELRNFKRKKTPSRKKI